MRADSQVVRNGRKRKFLETDPAQGDGLQMAPKKSGAHSHRATTRFQKKRPVTCDNFPSPFDSLRTIECTTTLLRGRFCVREQESSPRQTRDISPRARVDTVQSFYYAGLGLSFKMTFLSADNSFLLCNDRQPAPCTTACLRYGRVTG